MEAADMIDGSQSQNLVTSSYDNDVPIVEGCEDIQIRHLSTVDDLTIGEKLLEEKIGLQFEIDSATELMTGLDKNLEQARAKVQSHLMILESLDADVMKEKGQRTKLSDLFKETTVFVNQIKSNLEESIDHQFDKFSRALIDAKAKKSDIIDCQNKIKNFEENISVKSANLITQYQGLTDACKNHNANVEKAQKVFTEKVEKQEWFKRKLSAVLKKIPLLKTENESLLNRSHTLATEREELQKDEQNFKTQPLESEKAQAVLSEAKQREELLMKSVKSKEEELIMIETQTNIIKKEIDDLEENYAEELNKEAEIQNKISELSDMASVKSSKPSVSEAMKKNYLELVEIGKKTEEENALLESRIQELNISCASVTGNFDIEKLLDQLNELNEEKNKLLKQKKNGEKLSLKVEQKKKDINMLRDQKKELLSHEFIDDSLKTLENDTVLLETKLNIMRNDWTVICNSEIELSKKAQANSDLFQNLKFEIEAAERDLAKKIKKRDTISKNFVDEQLRFTQQKSQDDSSQTDQMLAELQEKLEQLEALNEQVMEQKENLEEKLTTFKENRNKQNEIRIKLKEIQSLEEKKSNFVKTDGFNESEDYDPDHILALCLDTRTKLNDLSHTVKELAEKSDIEMKSAMQELEKSKRHHSHVAKICQKLPTIDKTPKPTELVKGLNARPGKTNTYQGGVPLQSSRMKFPTKRKQLRQKEVDSLTPTSQKNSMLEKKKDQQQNSQL